MRFTDLVSSFFEQAPRDSNGNITLTGSLVSASDQLHIEEFAIFSVVDLLASAASVCEWRSYKDGVRYRGEDWKAWNIQPNPSQNGTEFKKLLFARLFLTNEALVFFRGGNLYLADTFSRVVNGFQNPIYSNIGYNGADLPGSLAENNVLHYRLAASSQALALKSNLRNLYSRLMLEGLSKYEKSGGKQGVLNYDAMAAGNKKFEDDLDKLMNNRFKRFFESKNAVLSLPRGYSFTPVSSAASQKSASEVGDIENTLRQAQTAACNAYHVPPSILRGEVTNLNDAVNAMLSFGLKPALKVVQAENNRKYYGGDAGTGWEMRIATAGIQSVSPFVEAQAADKLVQDRIYNPNGIRELLDDELIPEDWANAYTMTKNLQEVVNEQV